ncbi:5' nucleotidase, NT5C type [Weissella soli]|uniref:5' nucleotidase, NT5C type n=1 Tax=Weissella soli TaxID=155866 RepID=UPI003C762E02
MHKPKLFLDMDNTLVDTLTVLNANVAHVDEFGVAKPDQIPHIFRNLPPYPGAIAGIQALAQDWELYILSTAPWHNESSWSDKIAWLNHYFGNDVDSPFYKRVIMTHEKGFARVNGGILLDDRPYHGAAEWDDEAHGSIWMQYGHDERLTWDKELVPFLHAVARTFANDGGTEREALLKANGTFNYGLYGAQDSFKQENWEK